MRHIALSHLIWSRHLEPGMKAVDATAGRGHDALFIAKKVLTPTTGEVHILDIQKDAINSTKTLLTQNLPHTLHSRFYLYHQSHASIPQSIHSMDLIVYNLGYLPHSDKSITTQAKSTLLSLTKSLQVIKPKGIISIISYPGHPAGAIEHKQLENFLNNLNFQKILVSKHQWIKSKTHPVLWLIEKN